MSNFIGIDVKHEELPWTVELDGFERNQLESHYSNIEELEREKIFITAAKILSKCPDPSGKNLRSTGLALGKVQSGKTAAFIALMALAYDNRYRVIIVLLGTKKNLLSQNAGRITKLLGLDTRTDRKINSFSTLNNIKDVNYFDIAGVLENGNNVFITILKHPSHIRHIKELFTSSEINHYPTLIIDDEGDQATPNTQYRKRKKSPTYKQIEELRNVLKLHAFVSVTATPQANLLIRTIDELSPEFCVLIEPGNGYTGGSTFHGTEQDKYIREIPEADIPLEEYSGVPESFKKALGIFLVGAAIRTMRDDKRQHSMLVHTSSEKYAHKVVGDRVQILIDSWKQKIMLHSSDPGRNLVIYYLKMGYDDICKEPNKYPSFDEVVEKVIIEIRNLSLRIVNSSVYGQIPTPENTYFKNNVYIGGNMLDRGVTLDGLAVTYLTRWSKEPQADTVEQRARWFGYKREYLDVCRIFMPPGVSEGFTHLLGHEDDLWSSLRSNEANGIPVKDWPRIFILEQPFKPTRSNVANASEFQYKAWNFQHKPEIEFSSAKENVKRVRDFFEYQVNAEKKSYGNIKHLFVSGCNPINVLENLLDHLTYPNDGDWNHILIRNLFERLIRSAYFNELDLLLMDPDREREREVDEKGKIVNLMQGHSVRINESNPNYYKGDRDIHNNRPQLQCHIVRLHDKKGNNYPEETIALALYIPENLRNRLGRLMTDGE